MKSIITFPPSPHVYRSLANTRISYPEATAELVDNALDKGATRIVIELNSAQDYFRVSDNGAGCDDLSVMLGLGRRKDTIDTALGRYGVGLKNSACGLGRTLSIESTCGGLTRQTFVDWEALDSDFACEMTTVPSAAPNGTRIEIGGLFRRRIGDIEGICEKLGLTFSPAINRGASISFVANGQTNEIAAWRMPELDPEFTIEDEDEQDGYGFRVRAGILANGATHTQEPFLLTYRHRVLCGTSEPVGDYVTSPRFIAWVELYGQWALLKHKDGVSQHADWLHKALHDICEPLLKKVTEDGERIELAGLQAEAEGLLEGMVHGTERRNQGDTNGTCTPRYTGRRRKEAEQVTAGGDCRQRSGKRRTGSARLLLLDLPTSEIGKIDANGKRLQIALNLNHPTVRRWKDGNDRESIAFCAAFLAAGYIATREDEERQRLLPHMKGDTQFQTLLGTLSQWAANLPSLSPTIPNARRGRPSRPLRPASAPPAGR